MGKTTAAAAAALLAAAALAVFPARAAEFDSGDVLTLDEALAEALENNRELQEARAGVGISGGEWKEARASRGFTAKLQGGWRRVEDAVTFRSLFLTPRTNFISLNQSPPPDILIGDAPAGASDSVLLTYEPTVASVQVSEKETRTLDFVVTKPLYTFGRLGGRVKVSRLGHERDLLEVKRVRLKVTGEVKEAFFNVLLADEG
ncbi:MAG: TolC family protein, partial [bacterium]